MSETLIIREETSQDILGITHVNEQAFGHPGEAQAIEALRQRKMITLSLVAVNENQVSGHILFSPVDILSGDRPIGAALGLAPLAVLPAFQGIGIGSKLVEIGLQMCQERGHWAVILLGHPQYYARFGFTQASRFGLTCQWEVPEDAFMALELWPGALDDVSGVVYFQPEFDGL